MSRPKLKFAKSLLALLPSSDGARIRDACEPTELIFGSSLYSPGDRMQYVYFPTTSYLSLITPAGARPRSNEPVRSAVLGRDHIEIGLAENGGDASQDGCAFHVSNLDALLTEFKAKGLKKEIGDIGTERHDDAAFRVFYVVAPDGLCYWFGERESG